MSRIGIGRRAGGAREVGDPLDGLVNMFDIGLVLAVAALIAAAAALTREDAPAPERTERLRQIIAPPPDGERARGSGRAVGTVYRLRDGRLVYVPSGRSRPPRGARPVRPPGAP